MSQTGWRRVVAAFATMAVIVSAAGIAAAQAPQIERIGERVFLVRDKPGSSMQFQMIVLAGCADEAGGVCKGLAHYLEHLMVVGRASNDAPTNFGLIKDGRANAFTTHRATVYVNFAPPRPQGPAGDIAKLFAFYGERLRHLPITPQDADRERKVVRQEHDLKIASSAGARFTVAMDEILLPDHPFGRSGIGTPAEIAAFTAEAADDFRKTWYVPKNIYFVIRADIDGETIRPMVEQALEGLADAPVPDRPTQGDPANAVERRVIDMAENEVTSTWVSQRRLVRLMDRALADDQAAFSILLSYLSSRLPGAPYEVLVEKGKLIEGEPSMGVRRVGPATFIVTMGARPAEGVLPEKLEEAFNAYVAELGRTGVPARSVERLKTRILDQLTADSLQPAQVYGRLGRWLMGRISYEKFQAWPQTLMAVTPEAVNRLAAALAVEGKTVVGVLRPAGEKKQ